MTTAEAKKTEEAPKNPRDVARCCELMGHVMDYSQFNWNKPEPARLAGIDVGNLFSREKGGYTRSRLFYRVPAFGKVKERVTEKNLVLAFCPFCGKETQDL
jgi:hypothetical protein